MYLINRELEEKIQKEFNLFKSHIEKEYNIIFSESNFELEILDQEGNLLGRCK